MKNGDRGVRTRYVVSAKSGVDILSGRYRAEMSEVYDLLLSMGVPSDSQEKTSDDKVVYLTEEEASELNELSGIIAEPDLQCELLTDPLISGRCKKLVTLSGSGLDIKTVDAGAGHVVPNVKVYVFTDWQSQSCSEVITDAKGHATLPVNSTQIDKIAAYPQKNYWNKIIDVNKVSGLTRLKITLERLICNQNRRCWGIDVTSTPTGTGKGVRVGVIDTGVYRGHPNLNVTGGASFVNEVGTEWWKDEDGHGTHVTGVINARGTYAMGFDGYAPDSEMFMYRVFGGKDGGGYFSQVNQAIRQAIEDKCDILNLSLGIDTGSSSMRAKIESASEQGMLCVAAAGNSASKVMYPAAFDEVIAVSALGMFGKYPRDSLHALHQTSLLSSDGKFYAAEFTCFGSEISFIAPGVAILSTVPPDGYAAWNGTSMASPHVVGFAAASLSIRMDILNMPRDGARTQCIRDLIVKQASDIGMDLAYQGHGLPQVP
jgi:subtilisin